MPGSPSTQSRRRDRASGDYLVAGHIVRPHGVRGDLLVEGSPGLMASLSAEALVYLDSSAGSSKKVRAIRPHQNRFLLSLEGVVDRDGAERLRGREILIKATDAEALADGAYYHWQILGLKVVSDAGEALGTVTRIIETGANDVYVVSRAGEKDLLIPAIASVVRSVDPEGGTVTITLIPGLREAQA
jgi:16S rRNA processing protein RimM